LNRLALPFLVCLALARPVAAFAAPSCAAQDVAVEVLGSGGPMHAQGRGGSAYLLWLHHKPALVIDMGGDTPAKLSAAGVEAGSVPLLLVSHLHPDHVSGLADFLWSEINAPRKTPLVLAGPEGGGDGFPSIADFLHSQFDKGGLYPRMAGLFDGSAFALTVETVPVKGQSAVANNLGLSISAYVVDHGPAPALAYRVEGPGFAVVFGGDQTYGDTGFGHFAGGADLLVMHAMLTDRAKDDALTRSVGLPDALGARAKEAMPKRLILSHLMGAPATSANHDFWSLSDIDGVKKRVAEFYSGPIELAHDGSCYAMRGQR
jgi:ribonuclease BN (tRNA processing enzyme)